jgi:hypothetical protein
MKKLILGNHPWTSIIGLTIGVLVYLQQLLEAGQHNAGTIIIAIAVYLFGRLAADAKINTGTDTTTNTETKE